MFGITEFLRKEKLFKHLGGVAAGSGGSLPGAFAAADLDFKTFQDHFPTVGWSGFGPSEPKISKDYDAFLDATLPSTFEELKHPLGLSLTIWDDLNSLKHYDNLKQKGFGIAHGDLHEAMAAAVTTSCPHVSAPNCTRGFWPRRVNNQYPVTDGAFADVWGMKGLTVIPYCPKILHLLPLDYADQVEPPSLTNLPKQPKEMVTLSIVQPPTASHSYIGEQAMPRMWNLITQRSSRQWNKIMFEATDFAIKPLLNQTIPFKEDDMHNKQAVMVLDPEILGRQETLSEQIYDRLQSLQRDRFWSFYDSEGQKATRDKDWPKVLEINTKLNKKHLQRFQDDIASGKFRWKGRSTQ